MGTPPERETFSGAQVSTLSDLTCELYADALTADIWHNILHLLGRVVSYKNAAVLCMQPGQPAVWSISPADEDTHRLYSALQADMVALFNSALERGMTVWHPAKEVGTREWEKSEICRHMRDGGLDFMVCITCELGPGESTTFALTRESFDNDFADRDLFLLRHMRRHFMRASLLRKSYAEAEPAAETFRQVMRAGFICDSSGRVLEMNRFGRRIIEESDGNPQDVQRLIEEEAQRLIGSGANWSQIDIFGDKARLSVHRLMLRNGPMRYAVVIDSYEYFRRVLRHRMQDVGLTAREVEICMLLVQGMPNRKIAEALFIAESTVKDHMTSMLGKFGVSSRNGIVPKLLGYDARSTGG